MMQKDAFLLARDLIDIRSPLSVEAALRTPFLTHNMPEDKFSVPHSVLWNGKLPTLLSPSSPSLPPHFPSSRKQITNSEHADEIVESIAFNIISTGDVKDFASASLVCKQFFIVFQRQFLWYVFIVILSRASHAPRAPRAPRASPASPASRTLCLLLTLSDYYLQRTKVSAPGSTSVIRPMHAAAGRTRGGVQHVVRKAAIQARLEGVARVLRGRCPIRAGAAWKLFPGIT